MDERPQEKILAHLASHSSAPIEELCSSLSLSRTAVLYHLKRLIFEGKIVKAKNAEDLDRTQGRPRICYSLASTARPHNVILLADALLSNLDKLEAVNENILSTIAKSMAGPILTGSILNRINQAIIRLNGMNYSAYWQARPTGPCIHLANCPYAMLKNSHAELCHLDSFIIQSMLGLPVHMQAKSNEADRDCVFLVSTGS